MIPHFWSFYGFLIEHIGVHSIHGTLPNLFVHVKVLGHGEHVLLNLLGALLVLHLLHGLAWSIQAIFGYTCLHIRGG